MSRARKTEYVVDGVKYVQGAPCLHGHSGVRYAKRGKKGGGCVWCHTARNRGEHATWKDEHGNSRPAVPTFVMLRDWRVVMP